MTKSILSIFFALLGPILLIGHLTFILMEWWTPGSEGALLLVFFVAISSASLYIAQAIDSSKKDTTPCEPS